MDPDIRRRLSADHIAEIASRYGTTPPRMRLLDGYESFIYAVPDLGLVIRAGHSSRRTPELTHGEIDWMDFLAGHGVSVVESRRSIDGRRVELVSDGVDGEFVVSGFQYARGESLPRDRWDAVFARRYGELLGSMHALTLEYEPANPSWRRPQWNDPIMLFPLADSVPADQPEIRRQTEAVLSAVSSLPTQISDYGLIHQDAHSGNFFVDEKGRITLFDFDDCAYGWFAYDVALVFFYAVSLLPEDEATQFIEWFAPSFFEGYSAQHRLPGEQLATIPLFMRFREVDLYAMLHRDGEQDSDHWWTKAFMTGRRERIAAGRPVVEYPWSRLG